MKKCSGLLTIPLFLMGGLLWAETPPTSLPDVSLVTSSPTVTASTQTPSVALTGETTSAPTPNPMTERPGPGVFVTLTRTALPANELPPNAAIVKPETFQKFDAQNAAEAISHETGIETFPSGGQELVTAHIRGSSSNQTLVLIDGRPSAGMFLGTADLTEIPAEQIDHIEIVRGGVSALYGPNALGGVINVITKRATYAGLPISHISYENGSYGDQKYRLDFGSRYGPLDYFFFGNQEWISGFRDNSDARLYNIGGNVGVSMGSAGKLLLDVSSYRNAQGLPGLRCDTSDPFCLDTPVLQPNRFNDKDEKIASSPSARSVTDTNYVRASYLVNLPANSLMTLRVFGSQREITDVDPTSPNPFNAVNSDRHEQAHGGEAQFDLPLGFLVGSSFEHDREDVEDLLTPSNSFVKWEENWGIFAQETFHSGPFTLIPSGRYDENSQFGHTANPRVQTLDDATDWLRLSASAGRSFRAPSIDDITPEPGFNYLGNPNLQPETAWSYDAGFELHDASASLKVDYYRANISNFIQTFVQQNPNDPLSPFIAENLGRARRQGAEITINHVVNKYFRDGWNYTYLENVGIPAGFDHYVPLAFSPRHTVNYLSTITPTKKWTIDNTLRYEDARYSGNDETGTKMGSQLLWDLRVAYQWRQMELFIGSHDLANKRYVEQPGFPLPGRNYYGGIKLRLWG